MRFSLGASSWIVMPRGHDDLALGDGGVGRRELRMRRRTEVFEVAATTLLAPRPLTLRTGPASTADSHPGTAGRGPPRRPPPGATAREAAGPPPHRHREPPPRRAADRGRRRVRGGRHCGDRTASRRERDGHRGAAGSDARRAGAGSDLPERAARRGRGRAAERPHRSAAAGAVPARRSTRARRARPRRGRGARRRDRGRLGQRRPGRAHTRCGAERGAASGSAGSDDGAARALCSGAAGTGFSGSGGGGGRRRLGLLDDRARSRRPSSRPAGGRGRPTGRRCSTSGSSRRS